MAASGGIPDRVVQITEEATFCTEVEIYS